MLQVDRATVEALNRIAQHQPLRLAALLAADYLLVIQVAILLGLVVAALRRRDTHPLALAALSTAGAAGALGLNQLAAHLYLRLRPYWALPTVHPIGARSGSSSFFSIQATLAAAMAVGTLLIARRWGLASALLALLVALGQIMIGAHYPADVLTGLLVGGWPWPRCCRCGSGCSGCSTGCCTLGGPPQRHAHRSCAWAWPGWCCWPGLAVGWSPACKTTACAPRSTAPTPG
jgi:membrane-associated phospholipid phosphatase